MINRRLWKSFASVRQLLYVLTATSTALGVLIIAQAGILALIVTRVYRHHATLTTVQPLLVILLVVIGMRAIISGLSETWSLNLATKTQITLRKRLLQQLFQSGPLALAATDTGSIVTTAVQGIDDLEVFLARYIPQVLITATVPALIFIRVLTRDWLSGLVLLVTVPLIPLFMILVGRYTEGKTARQFRALSTLNGHFLDILHGLETLKLFGRSQSQSQGIYAASDAFKRTTMATLRVAFLSGLVLELLASLSMAIVAVEIGLRLIAGAISFDAAFMILILIPEFYGPWRALGSKFHDSLKGLTAVDQLFHILDAPLWVQGTGTAIIAEPGPWTLQADDLRFSYPGRPQPALDGLSFRIKAGELLAVIGPSGSGKSTLATLLLGLGPYDGSLRVEGRELRGLDQTWWRSQVTWLHQHPYLFYGTLADNLRMARPDASDDELTWALDQADGQTLMRSLPQGLHTMLEQEGRQLSAGQRQRIALARAFLRNTPLVMLDEATHNLDPASEEALELPLATLLRGRTAITIAHRLSTIVHADRLLVLNQGRVEAFGSLAELGRQPGRLREYLSHYQGGIYDDTLVMD
jgi:ATP-binding cassette subfamily C protein CydD